jgi:putative tryptophan/tyrosine transport system substrate-binding protein
MQFDQKRREFITLIGGAAAAWPLAARAQQRGRLPTIGFLGAPTLISGRGWLEAFVQRMRELGWIEGQTIVIEVRWGEGRAERYSALAAEFVRLKVDVIVTSGAAVVAAKQATSVIPIVFPAAPDPLGSNLVASLARPGGNVTGLSMQQPDLASKRLTILANVGYPSAVVEMGEVQAAVRTLGFEATTLEIRRAEDIAPAFEGLTGGADALYVCSEPLVNTNRIRVITLALGARLPTMYGYREFVESGGLMSYGPNIPDLFRRAGDYVDKILRGAKPGDLPVQQPTKFDLVINLTTAKALGLKIPESFLLRADEVIE